jgi:AraC family transcriptional regulator
MTVEAHGHVKYRAGRRLGEAEWPSLRVELRHHEPGRLTDLTLPSTEVAILLSGQATVTRTGDGLRQEARARPGTGWICPAGTFESDIEISATMGECLHVFLPPTLLEDALLRDHDLDASRVRLAYAGGLTDPMLFHIGQSLRTMLGRGAQPTDRLLVDGMRAALAGHLLGAYSVDRW